LYFPVNRVIPVEIASLIWPLATLFSKPVWSHIQILLIGAIVSIEDLTGIRERTHQKPRNKTERRRSNSWAFHQLRTFLEYKGISNGIEVVAVNPAYTSQSCHCCLHIGVRTEKRFKCSNKVCGWFGDADENGSKMIALLGASVSRPRGSELLSCAINQGLPKAYKESVSKRVGSLP
jgi:putative transposase